MKKSIVAIVSLLLSVTAFSQRQSKFDSISAHFDLFNYHHFEDLQLEDTAGAIFNIASLTGKTVYVDFWFTACPPCIKEIPYAKALQQYFSNDTNVVFVSICIENYQRKPNWKQMIGEKQLPGIHLFYARNKPQKINLLRRYNITFPTYLLVNTDQKIIGYDAPRPSEKGWVQWAILKAKEGKLVSVAYKDVVNHSKQYQAFVESLVEGGSK